MTDNTRNDIARHSLDILQLAVLDVLYQQPFDHAGTLRQTISAAEISKALGMQQLPSRFMRGILDVLEYYKYADYIDFRAYRISEKGISAIEMENSSGETP